MIAVKNIVLGSTLEKCAASDSISFSILEPFQNKICADQFKRNAMYLNVATTNFMKEIILAVHTGSLKGPMCYFMRAQLRGTH